MTLNVPAAIVAPLFVPANRPDRFHKAAASGADAIILDLEDAVSVDQKIAAREALSVDFTDLPILVRINAADTIWHADDLAAVARLTLAAVVLPKAERVSDVKRVALVHPVVALIESARGMAQTRALANSGAVRRLAFGSIDYAADLGCDHERHALAAARAEIVLASRLGDLAPPLDGVTVNLSDSALARDDARYAQAMGFGGKLAVHPMQIEPIFEGFAPDSAECAWAERTLASGDDAVMIDGMMVDAPVRARARAILARRRVSA